MKGFVEKVIVFAVILVSTIIVVNSLNTFFNEGQDLQRYDDAKKILKTIDAVTRQVSVEPTGSKRSININLPENAKLVFSGADDTIKVIINNVELLTRGGQIEEENIVVRGGNALSAYESDIDNDGNADIVLENPAVLFAVRKIGSETSYSIVNTSTIITMVRNKRQNIDMVPKSGVFINDKEGSEYGIGYVKMSQSQNQHSASILVHVVSNANITYDAIFTLLEGMDFIELEVRNVYGSV